MDHPTKQRLTNYEFSVQRLSLKSVINMTIYIVVMHATVSVAAMYVTVSNSNFIFLFLTDTNFS